MFEGITFTGILTVILNLILLAVVVFLLYFTVMPFTIYDQVATVKFDDTTANTNDELNNKERTRKYLITENQYSVYQNMGIASYNSNLNSVTLKVNNANYTFDLDSDKAKLILPINILYD